MSSSTTSTSTSRVPTLFTVSFLELPFYARLISLPIAAFGYGLSYSKFSYSGISLQSKYQADSTSIQSTNEDFVGKQSGESIYDQIAEVTIEVKNVGGVVACEVAQLVRICALLATIVLIR